MQTDLSVDKFIVFKIADCLLALPMNNVLKVINSPPINSGGLKAMGLVQLGRHTIRILDLYHQLSPNEPLPSPGNPPFLVITRSPQGELFGISVDEPPNLMELPRESLRSVPQSERQSGVRKLISHAAVIPQKQATTTIFLLDLKHAVE